MSSKKSFNKYLSRFDELIKAGERIEEQKTGRFLGDEIINISLPIEYMTDPNKYQINLDNFNKWRINCITLLDQILPNNNIQRNYVNEFKIFKCNIVYLKKGIAILRAIKEDFEKGFFEDFKIKVEAEIAVDYMKQAEQLLFEGQTGVYNHVPAAVLAGAVLEKNLRTLCLKQNPSIPVEKSDGKKLTLDPLITELKKVGVFNEVKSKELQGWASIRNSAAHGRFEEFNQAQVERMIEGIKDLLENDLT